MTDLPLASDLARMQFAFTVSFHIIFPAFSIGLASYLAVLEALWLKTGRQVYIDLFHYWLKIFALAFGMGVVSGIVMSYQFGSNWSAFSDMTGPVLGPLMGCEVLSAFFLGAGFLGVMLFGMNRVGKGLHFFATLMVAIGTLFLASYSGLGIRIYPYMVPPSITIWQAAAPDESLMFLLVGAVVLLPIIIGYTAYSYWVFRGKTRSGEGYH